MKESVSDALKDTMAETVTVGGVGRLHGVQCVSTGVDRGLEPELGAAPQARWLQDVPAYVTEVGVLSLCDRMCVCVCVCVCVLWPWDGWKGQRYVHINA